MLTLNNINISQGKDGEGEGRVSCHRAEGAHNPEAPSSPKHCGFERGLRHPRIIRSSIPFPCNSLSLIVPAIQLTLSPDPHGSRPTPPPPPTSSAREAAIEKGTYSHTCAYVHIEDPEPTTRYAGQVVVGSKQESVFLVFEYCDYDLAALLDSCSTPPFSEAEQKRLLIQLLDGVAYMHEHWVLHRDLKMSNILYHNGVLKVPNRLVKHAWQRS